jgi:heterodisulfide reductase subunit B
MQELAYFPGCTLYTKATHLDRAGRVSFNKLGIELKELPDWTCCGASFPLVNDYHMGLASPARVLADTQAAGFDSLATVCSVCFNVLTRTNYVFRTDQERKDKINDFIEREYDGKTEVIHFLAMLRDIIGFDTLAEKVQHSLQGLNIAAYYGCLLLRPSQEIGLDDPERPSIFEDFVSAVGATPVYFPYKNECCGAFQVIHDPDIANRCSKEIIDDACRNGADILITSCPLCQFNLDDRQNVLTEKYPAFQPLAVLYFTQVLGLALGLDYEDLELHRNSVDPVPILKERGIIKDRGSNESVQG